MNEFFAQEYVMVLNLGLINLTPWTLLSYSQVNDNYLNAKNGLIKIIPFAIRQDTEDVAYWELDSGIEVKIMHRFPERPSTEKYSCFAEWYINAVKDMFNHFSEDVFYAVNVDIFRR